MFSLLHCSLVLPIPAMALHRSMFLTIVQVNCLFFRHAFYSSPSSFPGCPRAVPTGFRLGGVFQNLGRLPFSHIFPESKFFSGKCWRRRGEVDVIFSKIFSEEIHRPWDTQNRKCKITCSTF